MLDLNRDHSVSTNCDRAKTKIQKGKKNTKSQSSKHSWIPKNCFCKLQQVYYSCILFHLSCCHGNQTQSKICFFRWHFPHFTSNNKNFLILCLHEVLYQTTLGFELGLYFYSTQALLTNNIKFSHRNNLEKGYWVAPPPRMKLFEVPPGIRCLKEQMEISTFFLIWAGVSVRNIEEVGSLELIFVLAPWRAGKNVENIREGFGQPRRGATSRVILKYGSWKSKKRFL